MVGTTGDAAHAVTYHNKHRGEDICPAPWSTEENLQDGE